MEYEVLVSVEKVISVKVNVNSEEEAIEAAKNKLMTSSEDFAQILEACVE